MWAAWYRAGYDAYASRVIAGATEPPHAKDLQQLTSQILTGLYSGDFAIALERGGAYARVIAAGQHQHAVRLVDLNPEASASLEHRSVKLQRTATELELCATAWRHGRLDENFCLYFLRLLLLLERNLLLCLLFSRNNFVTESENRVKPIFPDILSRP